ncbi:Hypothetical predicted protein [Mytilus galloprovincialis]|uniref:Uncharacterized protein n=1 Tax=Mytilus galloprovincialis TaxID=29158 RepID=A0A8B6HBA2_MYTGA|nr:Hypothetical predicted protein [Mytilus galloprovincialis]
MDRKKKAICSGHIGANTRLWTNFGDKRASSNIEIQEAKANLDVTEKLLKDIKDELVKASSIEDVVDEIQQTEYIFDLNSKFSQIKKLTQS